MTISEFTKQINFIECYITLTFIILLFNQKLRFFKQLFWILFISILNEFILDIQYCSIKTINGLNTTLYVIILFIIWFDILLKGRFKVKKKIISLYILFSIINILFIENWNVFNYNVFIIGSLMYVILFLIKSYKDLNEENLIFFQSNNFTLLFAPVLFFLGMSLMFSFRNKPLLTEKIFYDLELYTAVNYFVNFLYYSLIILYIVKERKLKNE